jgi:2-polyprenyl-3-methyl-5-hydroxy-6-metoxy-1,4-benzoquinol methylase
MTKSQDHWSAVYRAKAPDAVSWYQLTPEPSLRALDRFQVPNTASLIDVGGGASNLVDRLVKRGWADLTVLDIAAPALEVAKARLGSSAAQVRWEVADITEWLPSRTYDVWHDRAVFHFLTSLPQREAYRRALNAGVATGGLVIIATFAPDGPERCSGLPVQRYDTAGLAKEIGDTFRLVDDWREEHLTPQGGRQRFNWGIFRRD